MSAAKVREYYYLKSTSDKVGERLKVLRKQILKEYEVGTTQVGDHTVSIELRKSSPKIDEGILWEILEAKDLVNECIIEAIDHGAVKQAFIEGKITDDDLRAFNLGSTITPALSIKLVEEVSGDLQTDNESMG